MPLTSELLPGPADAGDSDEDPEREAHVDRLEVVLGRAARPRSRPRARAARRAARSSCDPPGRRPSACLVARTSCDGVPSNTILPPVCARTWAEVNRRESAALDRLFVVLDDEHGVAEIAQALRACGSAAVVALVQPDARLVEHVHDAAELRAELAREADPLGLAAAERRPRAPEREVVEPDVEQELEAVADLAQRPLGDDLLRPGELERGEVVVRDLDGHLADRGDARVADAHREALGPQALPAAAVAGSLD